MANGSTGTHEYNLTDHLGNVRAVIDQDGNVLQKTDYYPFGMPITRAGSSDNKYLYNGKEEQEETGWLDYGARMYDASIGRWFNVDPMVEEYLAFSQYVYCVSNPLTFVDPDGRKILFVNGYLGFGSPQGGSPYWGGANSAFVQGAQNFFKDKSCYFTNFEFNYMSSSSYRRHSDGYIYAKENYASLISDMDPQQDVFHVVSHSMGGTFAEGMIQYLKEQGWTVDMAIHFNAWQPTELQGSEGTFLIDATITNDWVQGLSISSTREIPNAAYQIRKISEKGWRFRHRDLIDNGDFWDTSNNAIWGGMQSLIQSWLQQNPNIPIYYVQ
jgi:RHS repeat-associated protein